MVWSSTASDHTHFTALQTQNCYFLADTVVTHQVEVPDTPSRPQYSHTLQTQMGKVSCLAGLTTALITDSLQYRKQSFRIHKNVTNTSDTPTVLYNYKAPCRTFNNLYNKRRQLSFSSPYCININNQCITNVQISPSPCK